MKKNGKMSHLDHKNAININLKSFISVLLSSSKVVSFYSAILQSLSKITYSKQCGFQEQKNAIFLISQINVCVRYINTYVCMHNLPLNKLNNLLVVYIYIYNFCSINEIIEKIF